MSNEGARRALRPRAPGPVRATPFGSGSQESDKPATAPPIEQQKAAGSVPEPNATKNVATRPGLRDIHVRRGTTVAELNHVLGLAEEAFRSSGLKLYAAVELARRDVGGGCDHVTELAFQQQGEKWGLAIVETVDGFDEGEDGTSRPLLQAPHAQRVSAAERLRDLWEALLEAAERDRVRTQRAAAKVGALLAEIARQSGGAK